MIRIALCDMNKEEGLRLRNLVAAYASKQGINNVDIRLTNSCEHFISVMQRVREGYFDFGIVRPTGTEGSNVLQKLPVFLDEVSKSTPQTHMVVCSEDPDIAVIAFEGHAQFLHLPIEAANFEVALGEPLKNLVLSRKRMFAVKSGKVTVNMNLNDITFVETNKKGPIIHLPDDRTVPVRGTLQALYERLSSLDDCFVRAGGSFIVNLENARSVGESSVIFSDGDAIILPTRSRKPLREALQVRQMRA